MFAFPIILNSHMTQLVGILRGLSYITNTVVADDLATHWARASANMLLASITNNIPVSVP